MRILSMVLTAILYSVIVFFAVVFLAVVQLRSSGGATFDTWRLNYDVKRQLADEQDEKLKSMRKIYRDNMREFLYMQSCLLLFDNNGMPQDKFIDEETRQAVKKAKEDRTPLDSLGGDVWCLVRGFNQLQFDRGYFDMVNKDYSREIEEIKKSSASNSDQLAELIKGHQDFVAFQSMASVWYQKPFFVSSYDLLVLLLVMMMGAVGGIVRLLRDYGSSLHPSPSSKDYFLIPLIGAVVAIGGYVLAKTGLLLLSSTRGETSLSPYMISLVGIISGLLAKEVIEKIAASGREILQQTKGGTSGQGGTTSGGA